MTRARIVVDLELAPVLGMTRPATLHAQALARLCAQEIAHHGQQVGVASGRDARHGVARLVVRVGDALKDAFEGGQRKGWRGGHMHSVPSMDPRFEALAWRGGRQAQAHDAPAVAARAQDSYADRATCPLRAYRALPTLVTRPRDRVPPTSPRQRFPVAPSQARGPALGPLRRTIVIITARMGKPQPLQAPEEGPCTIGSPWPVCTSCWLPWSP